MRPEVAETLHVRWQWVVIYCLKHRQTTLCHHQWSQDREKHAAAEVMLAATCNRDSQLRAAAIDGR